MTLPTRYLQCETGGGTNHGQQENHLHGSLYLACLSWNRLEPLYLACLSWNRLEPTKKIIQYSYQPFGGASCADVADF